MKKVHNRQTITLRNEMQYKKLEHTHSKKLEVL
jgi:hypothetical protein